MMYLNKIKFVFIFCMILMFSVGFSQNKEQTPNIVLVLMDDLGYGDLSCYGALDIRTPNIDQIALDGIRFTNYLTPQAVCSA